MRIIFAFVALFSVLEAWSCELTMPERLIVTASANGAWPFPQQGCSKAQFNMVHNVLQDQAGSIPLARLQAAIGEGITLVSTATHVRVENVTHIIRSTFADAGDASIAVTAPFQGSLIGMGTDSKYVLHCHPCQFNGEEVMRLHVKNSLGEETDYSFPAKFSRLVAAYKLRRQLPAFSEKLTADMFEPVQVPMASYGQYLTDLSRINLYKTNKTLRVGDVLRTGDLVPLTLVRAGDRVELIFENDHVRLKSQALSRQNGGVGDRVEVWNQANGKKYRGVVTEQNRVVVEL